MNLRGLKFHVNELAIENEEIASKLQQCVTDKGVNHIVVQVEAIVSKDNIECVIEGSTFDTYLTQPNAPTMELVEDVLTVKSLTTSIAPVGDFYEVTEYMELEPVLNWFGEPIKDMFMVVDVSKPVCRLLSVV